MLILSNEGRAKRMNVGDKVVFDEYSTVGYIVKIEIDPIEESEVNFEKDNWVNYTIRVFEPFYKGGYADFQRTRDDIALY